MLEKKFAIIDLGSNSVRMIIMKIYPDGSYKMIDQAKEMVRLSEGMGNDNILKSPAIERTLAALRQFKRLISAHETSNVFAIATAAVRSAANKEYFLDIVRKKIGFEFEVISGKQEGYYDYLGVINTININDCIIMDTGGASTEIVLVQNRKIVNVQSLPYGAVVLTEKFGAKNTEARTNIEEFIYNQLNKIDWIHKGKNFPVIGLGGSIRTLAKIYRKQINYPIESLHNYEMSYESVKEVYEKVVNTSITNRKNIPGISKGREDIIVAGFVPVVMLMKILCSNRLIISGNGLRDGVFYENYFNLYNCGNVVSDVCAHSIENILRNYEVNIKHSYHVQKLSLMLFDKLKNIHGFGIGERKLLSAAALLHDIGVYVDYYKHHKHGFYLVLNSRLYGLNNRELVLCAFIVGMHRSLEFKYRWKKYKKVINKSDLDIIRKLALFVRIAEHLDRNEYASVKNISCNITDTIVKILLESENDIDLEIVLAMKNENIFKKLFGKKLIIIKD